MPRRKGQVRFGWRNLSPSYRDRLTRRGITQAQWELGADLRQARGHKDEIAKTRPRSAAGKKLTERLVQGEATPADIAAIQQWRDTQRPAWIPAGIRADVAAALSQLPSPQRWTGVKMYPQGEGRPWTMEVTLKGNAYPVTVEIPGGGEELSGAWQVLDLLSQPPSTPQWKNWSYDRLTVERTGY